LRARPGAHRGLERAPVGVLDDQRWSRRMGHKQNRSGHPIYQLDINGTRH
jgi:hypothetical protein